METATNAFSGYKMCPFPGIVEIDITLLSVKLSFAFKYLSGNVFFICNFFLVDESTLINIVFE